MLSLQVQEGEVFCHYVPNYAGPNVGGYLGRCWPGGKFKDWPYEKLVALGTGCHNVVVDERADSEQGESPEYPDSYGWAHFCYNVGAITRLEVKRLTGSDLPE